MATVGQYGAQAVLSPTGALQPLTNILVLNVDGTNATVYTDITGASGGTGSPYNPALTDSRGNLTFYAAPGQYLLSMSGSVFATVYVPPPGSVSSSIAGLQSSYSTLLSDITTLQSDFTSVENSVQLYGVGGALIGTLPPLGTPVYKRQVGTSVQTTNSAGGGVVNFPFAFPSGVATIDISMGDNSIAAALVNIIEGQVSLTGFGFIVTVNGIGLNAGLVRVNWECVGF